MATYSTNVDICNKALQELGCAQITTLSDNSRNANECNFLYDKVRVTLLREHPWLFSIKYATLNEPTGTETYQNGETRNSFTLPSDYARLADQNPREAALTTQATTGAVKFTDYSIEGGNLLTAQTIVILRYASLVTNVATFDPLFCDVMAARMGVDGLAETLTQSPVKRQLAERRYVARMLTALQTNLIEAGSDEPLEQFIQMARILFGDQVATSAQQGQGREQQ